MISEAARVEALAGQWPDETRDAWLDYLSTASKREIIKDAYSDAADLARALDPNYRITPAIALIARNIETALTEPHHNLLVSTPPQEGKTSLCAVYAPLRALQLNRDARIILASYSSELAQDASRRCRELINTHGSGITDPLTGKVMDDKLGYQLAPGSNKMSSWKLRGARGGMVAVGLGASITGRAADTLLIDDPIKNPMEADSANHRRKVANWFSQVARTRLSPRASMVLVMCMTGDTPVLMADGTQRQLRYVRPGDAVATYENGHLSTSTVRNWANQGPDEIFAVRLKSGRIVRANARHPFLISEGGREVWRRTDELLPGNKCLAVRGSGLSAPWMNAVQRLSARACAPFTTTGSGGQMATAVPALQRLIEIADSRTATGSTSPDMRRCLQSKAGYAQSAVSLLPLATRERTGMGNSVSTIATSPVVYADSSATIATSPLDTGRPRKSCAPQLTIYRVKTDEIVEVVQRGVEDVFDIQIDRTENFIANGLVSHNTRWHPDDLAGRILADELGRDPRFRTWKHINIPAISEEGIRDDLGREPGVAMVSARGRTKQEFEQTRREVGDRTWFSMYQGVPRNPEGGLFARAWFEPPADMPADAVATVVGVDPADSGHDDDTGIIAAALTGTGTVVFTDDWSGQFTSDQWSRRAVLLALTVGAREIGLEAYSAAATYENALKAAYRAIHTDALMKRRTGADLTLIESRALSETPPFLVYKWRAGARIDAVGRSALLRQALETRRARVVEHKMANLIEDAADWQIGQHCPDRVAAAVIAHDRLAVLGSGRMTVAAPVDRPNEQVVPFRRPGTGGEGFRRRLRRP